MKLLQRIFSGIQEWSEETRRFLAVFVMVIVIVIVFNVFTRGLSSRLTALSLKPAQELTQETPSQNKTQKQNVPQVLSPAAGLSESFKSLEEFAKGVSLPKVSLPPKESLEKQAGNVLRALAGIWNAVIDRVWRWVYLP